MVDALSLSNLFVFPLEGFDQIESETETPQLVHNELEQLANSQLQIGAVSRSLHPLLPQIVADVRVAPSFLKSLSI